MGASNQFTYGITNAKITGQDLRQRMQIEETFRDLKSPAYGLGLRNSRTSNPERFDIMLLIALMLQLSFWLAGVHAQQ